MSIKELPVRGDGQMASYFRYRRDPTVRRQHRRQAPGPPPLGPPVPESEDEEGEEEDDDDEEGPSSEDESISTEGKSPTSSPSTSPTKGSFPGSASISSGSLDSALSSLGMSATATFALSTPTATTLATRQSSTLTLPRNQVEQTGVPTGVRTARPTSTFDPESEALNGGSPPAQTRTHSTLSHGATIALEVVGIMVAIGLLLGGCFILYRRYKKRKAAKADPNYDPDADRQPHSGFNRKLNDTFSSAKSQWGGWSSIWGGGGGANDSTKPSAEAANEAERQQRMGRVRTSLLGEKELRGGLMDIGNGSGLPSKAVLRNEGDGRMGMNRTGGMTEGGAAGFDARGGDIYNDTDRVQIEASGRWEDSVTIARASVSGKNARGLLPAMPTRAAQTGGGGGLGNDYLQARAQGPAYDMRNSLTTISKELAQDGYEQGGLSPPPARRATQYSESQYDEDAGGGSEKSWTDRVKARESKVSLAKWRDPVSWVKDQVDRRNGGMERLPG